MSQTSHVGAIISTGTAYKAAVGETVARRERKVDKGDRGDRQRKENRNSETGGSSYAWSSPETPRFECKAGPNGRRSSRFRINFVSLNPGTRTRPVCLLPLHPHSSTFRSPRANDNVHHKRGILDFTHNIVWSKRERTRRVFTF